MPPIMEQIREKCRNRQLYLWGASFVGRILLRIMEPLGFKITAFIDTRAPQFENGFEGYPVFSPREALGAGGLFIIVAATPQSDQEIVRLCLEAGLRPDQDFLSYAQICATGLAGLPLEQFSSYQNLSLTEPAPATLMPPHLAGAYTEGGRIPVVYSYFNNKNGPKVHNTAETYQKVLEKIHARSLGYYGREGDSFYEALEKYDLKGQSVLIWGLAGCNCEALALWRQAERVYVVDYNRPVCEHEKIRVLSHDELRAQQIKTDAAISFSSFEHDGLGQFGDPLRPDGDFQAMRDAWEHLPEGGLLFLGLPLGRDCLVWNLHRIYGRRRLPQMLRGWICRDVYNVHGRPSADFPFDQPLGRQYQPLLVLEKTAAKAGRPLEEALARADREADEPQAGLRDTRLWREILRSQARDLEDPPSI